MFNPIHSNVQPIARIPELGKRILTAAIGGPVLIAVVIYGGWPGICFLTFILSLGMIYEFSEMTFGISDRVEKRYALLLATWFAAFANFVLPHSEFEILSICFLALFSYFLFSAERHHDEQFYLHFKELMYSLFGILYLVFLPLYLTRIHASSDGANWTIVFFLIVWAGDSAAYFVGKKFGRVRLYAYISPKKTREGAIGGLLAGIVVTVLFKLLFFRNMPWTATIVIPTLVGVFAQIGDFCESFLKRAYNKKDSGTVLPGHGGFLDRFDGVVFSLPVMYACIRMFGA